MRNVLILGLGGTGANVVDLFFADRKDVSCFVLDSDVEAISEIACPKVCMTEKMSLGNAVEKLDKKTVSGFFPCEDSQGKADYIKTLEMGRGANGWRMKGLLSFEYMLSDSEKSGAFHNALDALFKKEDHYAKIEIIIAASLVGGTGSALFLPVALYIKRYFKSKFGRDVAIKALLACPDVYANALTAEKRVKACANAYAALQELNAVDLVCRGYNKEAKAASRCLVNYRIGSPQSRIGVLFDAANPEFGELSAQPFASVYLFDKIPGTDTIPAHERVMARILGIILNDETPNVKAVFSAVSIAEVVFSGASIAEYVAKKKIYDDMGREWLALYAKTPKDEEREDICEFAKNFTGLYRSLYTKNRYSQHLALGRETEEELLSGEEDGGPSVTVKALQDYAERLKDRCFALLESEVSEKAKEEIKKADKDVANIGLFDFKKTKRKKVQTVKDRAARYHAILLDYFKAGTKTVHEKSERIRAELLSANDKNSIFNNLIVFNGKFLHPVMALLLLSEVYLSLRKEVPNNECEKIYSEAFFGKELPDFLFARAGLNANVTREYAQFGPTRLKTVASADAEKLPYELVAAFPEIKSDFIKLYSFITEKLAEQFIDLILGLLSALIKKYRELLDVIPSVLADYRTDLKLALVANTSDTCTLMNVGCSEANKNEAYARYGKDKTADSSRDEMTGRIFFRHAVREGKENLFSELCEEEKKRVLENHEIKNACEANIFRVLLDRDIFKENLPERTLYRDFEQAFGLVPLPLDLEPRDRYTNEQVDTETVTMVPVEAAQFAQIHLRDGDLSPRQAAEKYAYLQGGSEANIIVSETVPKNRIFATRKVRGFPLYLFNKINEAGEGVGYYKFYRKALSVKKEQDSQMWDPHLVKENARDFLPYIDPAKRDEFERSVYKAVFYMLQKGLFSVEQAEGNKDYFCYKVGERKAEVLFEKKRVTAPEQLFGFMRENAELAEVYGAAYDREFEKECSLLPPVGFEKTDLPVLKRAILNGKTFRFLSGDFMANVRSAKPLERASLIDILCAIYAKAETATEAEGLGRTVAELLEAFVSSRSLSDMEVSRSLYCELLNCLRNACAEGQDAKSDAKKFQKAFSFIKSGEERD